MRDPASGSTNSPASPEVIQAELTVDRLTQLGHGAAPYNGRTVFVEGAFPGERVLAQVLDEGKALSGRALDVLHPHPARRKPPCPLSTRCGGCDWQFIEDSAQRDAKLEMIQATLEHQARLPRDRYELRPTLASPQALGYRRRAVLQWGTDGLTQTSGFGFFGKGTHQLVTVERCPALVPELEALLPALREHLGPVAKQLDSVHLLAEGTRRALALFLKGPLRERTQEAVSTLQRSEKLSGAVIQPKDAPGVVVGQPALRSLYPLRPEIPLYVRPDAFSQANAEGNVGLVASAIQMMGAGATDEVLELYCGNGNFTFALAGTARWVTAVESAPVSVSLAQRSAHEGQVSNVRFIQGDVDKVCAGLLKEKRKFSQLFVDPPRTGAPQVARWARDFECQSVLYVACDVGALARDVASLMAAGYAPRILQLVDMFPQTHHAEVVMRFERSA